MNTRKKYFLSTILLVLLLLLVTIGYAYLSTTLSINGTSSISNASWDVHFENVQVTTGSVTANTPSIDSNRTTVTYNVTLSKPGDFYEFTVDAKNDGSIDAMIDTITSTLNNTNITTLPSYLNYSVTYSDGNQIQSKQELNSGSKETYKIRVEFKKDISSSDLPSTEQNLSFSFTVTYVQKDDTSIVVAHPIDFSTDSWETIIGAVQSGNTSAYNVGDTKDIDMGSYGIQQFRIVNKSTPEVCNQENFSQSGCGFVLESVYLFYSGQMNSTGTNVGGWPVMPLRSTFNNTIYNEIQSPVKESIIDTLVISGEFKSSGASALYPSTDKLFVLSYCELYMDGCNNRLSEYNHVRVLDYYSSASTYCKFTSSTVTSPQRYLTRTPFTSSNNTSFCLIDSDSCDYAGIVGGSANYYYRIPIAFRIG